MIKNTFHIFLYYMYLEEKSQIIKLVLLKRKAINADGIGGSWGDAWQ